MASFLSVPEIEFLRNHFSLPKLEIVLKPTWGADQLGYREGIHGDLREWMIRRGPLCDASISHTHGLGGFAFNSYAGEHITQIGFDVELSSRVREVAVQRIAFSPEEVTRAPSPDQLWVAKEAAFKALKGKDQPKLVSQIHIQNWQPIEVPHSASQFKTCVVDKAGVGLFSSVRGMVFQKKSYALALFVCFP